MSATYFQVVQKKACAFCVYMYVCRCVHTHTQDKVWDVVKC